MGILDDPLGIVVADELVLDRAPVHGGRDEEQRRKRECSAR
jgi:hypothetical protein